MVQNFNRTLPNPIRQENLIKCYITTKNYAKSPKLYSKFLKDFPGDTGILEVAGLVEVNAGDYQKAKVLYDSAYSKNPAKKEYSPEYAFILWKQ